MASLTTLTPAERHRSVAAKFSEHIAAVPDWNSQSPVHGWVARDIVEHLMDWSRDFLQAGAVALPAQLAHEGDPSPAWAAHCAAIQGLLDGPDAGSAFSHPFAGSHRLSEAIDRFYTADVFMHTWDLATTVGRESGLDPEFATELLTGISEMEDILRGSGHYGPAVPVPADADPVIQLAGFIGRDPNWRNC